MIPVADLVVGAVGVLVAGVGGGILLQDALPPEAQAWTTLALMAAIGGWLVKTLDKIGDKTTKSIDANTEAQNKVATAMALLTQRETDAQHATEAKRIEIVTKIDRLAEEVRAIRAS